VSFLTPVWNYIDALMHPSAQRDALTAARHRAFIDPRLLGSFAALASFPIYIAFRSVPSVLELGAFGWLVAPILINFISNAIKFTPRRGRVVVSATCDGPKLAVAVEDTGLGIGEADLPHPGEAFFQARASYDRRQDGTGLGLSIVKDLVRMHGGNMDIRSQLGTSTRVAVRLTVDCEGTRPAVEPIQFVTERGRELAAAANMQARKSA